MDFKRLDNIQSFGGSTAWLFISVSAPTFSYPAPSSKIRTNCGGGGGGSRFGMKGGVGPPFVSIHLLVLCRRARLSEGHTCVCARSQRPPLPTTRPASCTRAPGRLRTVSCTEDRLQVVLRVESTCLSFLERVHYSSLGEKVMHRFLLGMLFGEGRSDRSVPALHAPARMPF